MTPRSFPAVAMALVVSVVAGPVAAQTGQFDLEKTKSVLSGLIEKVLKDRGVPSISIALVKDSSIVWKAAFGYANVRTLTPATTETIYSTGSTFKSATATALMQLAEQGKLSLDHPVNRYLGDVRIQDRLQTEKPVTFTHILSHWSGLTAGAVTKPIWGRELPKPLEKMVADLYSIRPVETKWEYNNFAYGMAGLLIEKISGTDYQTFMVDNVLKPIGVATATPVYPSPEMVEVMALPYNAGGPSGKARPVAQVHFDVYPAGDIYLTAEDMARFLGVHLNGGVFNGKRILSEQSVKKMREPQFGGNYGFGFSVKKDAAGHTLISHGGGIPGQSSFMMGDVDARVGVYYMSNSGAPSEIAEAAIALLRGEEYISPADRKAIAVDPKVLERYVGVYEVSGDLLVTVSRDGALLRLKQGNSPTTSELQAETPVRFFVKGSSTAVTFLMNAAGVVDRLSIDMTGQTLSAKRRQ